MPNMQQNKTPMRELDPMERRRNFEEVACGYNEEEALNEAERCLNCKNRPCVNGCPVNVRIPDFIAKIKEKDYAGAYKIIKDTNSLPAVCGRVCPQENQCEKFCVRGIKGESVGIGRLERFAADYFMKNCKDEKKEITKNHIKCAVVGSGPAGLTCAGDLAAAGFDVTVFEALHTAGGVLMYGIPQFRLPKEIVAKEIDSLRDMGVEFVEDTVVGKTELIDELFEEGYKAVFIGSGAGLPSFMGIEGETLNGVFAANEVLTRINLMKGYKFPETDTPVYIGKKVAVVGGGNVAMDAARCSMRMGAENVYIVYRRSMEEIPARAEEIEHAKMEGIEFKMLTNPTKILDDGNGNIAGMECVKMELGEPDASGRRRPVVIEGSEYVMDVDTVIIAIGQSPNPLIRNTTEGLETNKRGCIVVNEETMQTSLDGVYAGGDAVTGAATVILAMGAGKAAAKAIKEKLL
ncbi:MAG: NADPH-dependent glutamate synthase [Clostridia bacterium]|nr:NADPH-dependent glutamate synthase [Clostridia bacterium]